MTTSIPFEEFERKALDLYPTRSYAPATIHNVRQVLREVAALQGSDGRPLVAVAGDLNADVLLAWSAAHPDRSPARAEALLRTLRPIVKYGVARGFIGRDDDPFAFRSPRKWASPGNRPAPRRGPVRARSAEQIGRLLRLLDAEADSGGWKQRRLQALAYFYAYTGVRKMEALQLPVDCVDFARRCFRIQPRADWSPKTARSAAVLPLAGPLLKALAVWMPMTGGRWVFPTSDRRRPWLSGVPGGTPLDQIKAAAVRAGIGEFTILGFRKSLGTLAAFWGVSDAERRRVFRHTEDSTAVVWYEDPVLEEMRPTVAKIVFGVVA